MRPPAQAVRHLLSSAASPRTALTVATIFLLAACAGGGVTTPGDDEEEPGLTRSELEVTVRISEEDGELASALGWEGRRVPGARVTVMRETGMIGIEDSITKQTGTDGTVRFSDLLPNTKYRTKVARPLTSDEMARVGSIRSGVRLLGGGWKATSGRPTDIIVDANRTGSLVISEVVALQPNEGPGADYQFASYVEVYNNSDRTITLDGMVIGRALSFDINFTSRPCSETRSFQSFGDGIWSRFFQAFPGSGGEHSVSPGETVVVATDAIDHTEVASFFPNLQNADFEFEGSSDVDNPDVPNMEQIGLREWFFGHGLSALAFPHFNMALFLSESVEVDALQRGRPDPANDDPFVQFPADKIVDVTTTVDDDGFEGKKYCADLLPDQFEELGKVWTAQVTGERLVHIRRLTGEGDDGHPILLDTNTSDVDFRWGQMTPDGLGLR